MTVDDLTEKLARAKSEGFPCPEADQIEEVLATLVAARAILGPTALRLRRNARLRFNKQRQQVQAMNLARAQKQDAPLLEQRSA